MSKTKRPTPTPKKKIRLWAILASALILAACAIALGRNADDFPKVEISGHPVSREEYVRAMYQARNDILSDHAAAGISLSDWTRETGLGDPCALAAERALEILTEYYAVSTLAVERGYLEDASYAAMERELAQLNEQRRQAMDSGAVFTGVPTVTLTDYLTYRASGFKLQFCSDPANPENEITDAELQARYEADRDSLYRQSEAMELAYILIDAGSDADAWELILQKAWEIGDLTAALAQFPQLGDFYREVSVTPGNYASHERAIGDVLALAQELEAGELSRVFRQEDRLCLVLCKARTGEPYAPLSDVASVVAQSIRESRYDALLAERMENMEIRGDLDKLYRFTAEQLG